MIERSGIVPIVGSKISLRAIWNTTGCNDDSEQNKPNDLEK
jgi:hypothetical protein